MIKCYYFKFEIIINFYPWDIFVYYPISTKKMFSDPYYAEDICVQIDI